MLKIGALIFSHNSGGIWIYIANGDKDYEMLFYNVLQARYQFFHKAQVRTYLYDEESFVHQPIWEVAYEPDNSLP